MFDSVNKLTSRKIGVIGSGYWGRKHVEEYIKIGLEPVVYDQDEKTRFAIQDDFDVDVVPTLDKLLSNSDIGGVSICTPNPTHYEVASKALHAGKHVLLEKPMTLDYETSLELVHLAKGKNLTLSVGHLFRFNNAIRHVKNVLDSNKLGKVYLVKLNWSNLEPIFHDRDVLFDLAPHPFDILDYFFDDQLDQISCIGKAFRKEDGEEAVFVNGMIKDIMVHLEVNWLTLPKSRKITITGEYGSLHIDTIKQTVNVMNNGSSYSPDIIPSNTIQEELIHFIKCINDEEMSLVDGFTGARIVKTIELTRKSLEDKKTIYRETPDQKVLH